MKFERFEVGARFQTEPYLISQEEIVEFAEKYDSHYYHVDSVKAKRSLFRSIVASGMHTMSIINRQWVMLGLLDKDMLGGLGIDARWMKPVFPDDIIRSEVEVLEKQERDKRSGVVTFGFTGFNQNDDIWARVTIRIMVLRERIPVLAF